MEHTLSINLPFDVGYFAELNPAFPSNVPFELQYDAKRGFIAERMTKAVREALKKYYEIGGYGSTPLGEGAFATRQGNELFEIIQGFLKENKLDLTRRSFLEIGSSYGYLLYLLKKAGAREVLGVEPGDEGVIGGKKYRIPFIQDFFPSPKIDKEYDCIISHAVLEHVEDAEEFLKEIYKKLTADGLTFVAVPDSEKKMLVGDGAILTHQHINYFTKYSLDKLMRRAGFSSVQAVNSDKRSILYGWGFKSVGSEQLREQDVTSPEDIDIFKTFAINFKKNIDAIQKIINSRELQGKTIGLYAPSLGIIGSLTFKRPFRAFDSDAMKYGKMIAGCPVHFEGPDGLIRRPVDVLLIAAIDYDTEIKEDLTKRGLDRSRTEVISLKKIYEENSSRMYDVGSTN